MTNAPIVEDRGTAAVDMNADTTKIHDRFACRTGPITFEMQDEDFHAVIADAVGQVFITNGVGKHIIGLCDGLNTKEQIVSTVMSAYGSTAVDQVRKEVMRFLTAVTNMGVVTWTDAPRAPSGRHRSPRSP